MESQAKVVIIGGGMMGVGLLYHLLEEGWKDCVLIEKGALTSGSTWHAAGQCPSFVANYNMAMIHQYSNTLYANLEEMTGMSTGWHNSGGIRLATRPQDVDYFHLVKGIGDNVGFNMEIIDVDKIREINPFMENLDGVLAGAWTFDDGHVDPSSCCNAMAAAARKMGGKIILHNRVLGVTHQPNGEFEVQTEQGNITCEHLVNAAGGYADRVGAWLGVDVPYTNLKHQYVVTEEIPEFAARDVELPVMRDPYPSAYYRQEQNSGLIGIYERSMTREAWAGVGQDWDAENELFPAEYDPIMPWLERVMERMPIFESVGIMKVINGAIAHTIDSNPLLGPAAGVKNFWMCAGSSIGIAQGAGCGKYLAQWMVHGAADINMVGFDPRRFGSYADKKYTDAWAHQEYWDMYDMILPGEERVGGRPARITPLYEKLKAKGCVHTEAFGWERPKWFSLNGTEEETVFRRNNIFGIIAEECKAVRERVGVQELPSFSKFDVSGPDAEAFLNRITANKVAKRKGGIVLTHALNEIGRIETEFTITRLADDKFYLLSGAVAYQRDLDLLHQSKLDSEDVTITDVTDDYTVLVVAGPHARDVLSKITDTDLSNDSFKWLTGQEITIAGVDLRALRVNYVGELGWELHTPMNGIAALYDAVWAAGEEFGIADYGTYAMNSLRMEKAYAGWGVELTNEITPVEAALDRFVNLSKEFVGKDHVEQARELLGTGDGLNMKIAYVEIDANDADVYGGEPVFANGECVGLTTSGAYGHTVQKSLSFVYVEPKCAEPGTTLEIEILGERCKSTVLAEPAYDPQSERSRM